MAKVGSWNLATPAGTDAPSTLDNVMRDTRTDVKETLDINMDSTTGRLNVNASSLTVANAGIMRLQSTAKVLEVDDGTNIRPMNYRNFGTMNATARSSDRVLLFSLNSATAFTYAGVISIKFVVTLSTGAGATDTIAMNYGTVAGVFPTLANSVLIGSTSTGQKIACFSGTLAAAAVYWNLTISGSTAVYSNVGLSDHQAHWEFFGNTLA